MCIRDSLSSYVAFAIIVVSYNGAPLEDHGQIEGLTRALIGIVYLITALTLSFLFKRLVEIMNEGAQMLGRQLESNELVTLITLFLLLLFQRSFIYLMKAFLAYNDLSFDQWIVEKTTNQSGYSTWYIIYLILYYALLELLPVMIVVLILEPRGARSIPHKTRASSHDELNMSVETPDVDYLSFR
eukprot:TRINITY_DN3816_c0_g1_i1.p1 TRINITY_DN3816_c0_g1~~TRINITY_DN3816_c0_g1_i1.p1  ORF type:complete len:185 (+),score=17.26 TRINITY_DN3816_c0_g1_i1:64-618(+)